MRWTGSEIDDPIDAFHALNVATDWRQFTEALHKFTIPGQNVVYADVRGNIGYQCAVRLPLRNQKHGLLPLPGWDPASDWKGFVPVEQLPQLFNPPEGYIASANNKTVDDSYPYYVSDLWEPESRIVRLRSMLGVPGVKLSVRDFETLQTDTYSSYAHEMIPLIVKVLRDSSVSATVDPRVLEYFLNWDSRFTKEDIAPAIYHHFLVRLIRNTLADEMGEELFHDFVILTNVPLRVIARLVKEGTSTWFDDVRTPEVETRDDILKKSLRDALADLERERGGDMRTWRWGEMHTVTIQHPFGLQKPLDKIFSLGPFPIDGGPTALISGEYDLNKPFAVRVGASYRMIFDLGNPGGYRAVLTSGQSGQVFHRHYDDQTPLWLHGAYRTVRSRGDDDLRADLRLVPVQ
jgi:penicillin amidase